MKFQRNEQAELDLLQKMWGHIEEDRSEQWPGVTTLIYCLTKAYWERTLARPIPNRQTLLYFVTGLALEKTLIWAWQGSEELAGEHEGIFYHIDGWDGDVNRLIEFKSTRSRITKGTIKVGDKRDILASDYSSMWMKQMAAYAYIKGIENVRLIVLHLMEPEILVWDIEFDKIDIMSNQMMLQSRRTDLLKAVETGKPPKPFTTNEDWECKNCVWLALCEARKND